MIWRRRREPCDEDATDAQLHRAVLNGSQNAMTELYRRHGGLVYRFALRLVQETSIAEEVTQEVFLALLKHADRFVVDRGSLSTWLCGIARRLVWKHLRAQHRDLIAEDGLDEVESHEDDPAVALTRKQAVQAVDQGIRGLPPNLREVIVLCELEEMRYEDAAVVLGVPIGTVRSRLHRAKHRLALLLTETKIEERQ